MGGLLPNLVKSETTYELLNRAAEDTPSLLHSCVLPVLEFCMQTPNLQSLQVVATLVPHVKHLAEISQLVGPALSVCWNYLTQVSMDEWDPDDVPLQPDAVHNSDDESNHAETLLFSLLKLPHALPTVLPVVEQALLTGGTCCWQHQWAALCVLQCCLEAIPVSFAPHERTAAAAARTYCHDSHPRVQYQAVQLLGVLCERTTTPVEVTVLEALVVVTASKRTVPKVLALACQAMVGYCRPSSLDCERPVVPYLDSILNALVSGPLSCHTAVVQVRAVGALACFAERAGAEFGPWYAQVMPQLLAMAQQPGDTFEKRCLAGASLEAASIVGQAVDAPELFHNEAIQIMNWAVQVLQNPPIPMDQLLSACARIASVLRDAYVPYVDKVLPYLLARATDPADVEFSKGDIADLDADDGQAVTVAVPGQGLTKVTLNTTNIQEKALAARAVYEHAVALQANFAPYSKECLEAFLPLVAFKYSSDIRGTASQTLAAVFECCCTAGERTGNFQLAKLYLPRLVQTIGNQVQTEDAADVETVLALADSLSEICRTFYLLPADHRAEVLGNMAESDVLALVQGCMKSMLSCLERRSALTQTLHSDQTSADEKQDIEALLQGEEDLLTPLVDSIGYVLKSFREAFFSLFETEVATKLGPFLTTGKDIRARVSAVCLFDDCVEHCGATAAAKYGPVLLEGILMGLNDDQNGGDVDLKRASIYGIAQIARYSPPTVLAACAQNLVSGLFLMACSQQLKNDEIFLYETAVSGLASLVLFDNSPFRSAGYVKRDTVVQTFLSSLPLREDEDEAKICHAGLCDLVENGSIDVKTYAPMLQQVIPGIFELVENGEEVADASTCARLRTILTNAQHRAPGGFRSMLNIVSP